MEELIQMLHHIHPLSGELEIHLRSKICRYTFSKGELLLSAGQVAGDILYLRKGLVRSFYRVRNEEVSNWFMKEGDICISILSFFRQEPSVDSIMAVEDCECWGFTHAELEETYRDYPEFNLHGRLIATEYYCRSEIRHKAIRRQTPEDKYEQLMETDPELINRVPLMYMASYLNVGDRTFSIIRKDYAERQLRKR